MRTCPPIPLFALLATFVLLPPARGKAASPESLEARHRASAEAPASLRDHAITVIDRWVLGLSQVTLDNGLRIVLAPEPESPTVSLCVTYDVGSRNEAAGRSGFAHLFEHLMFQGSRNVPKGGHFTLVTARGGQVNGATSSEVTQYYETLPANELELGLWLEADRMRWLDVSQENFENQRAVVQEEFRMRVENSAYEPATIELEREIYAGYPPYEHPTIGSMEDLALAKLDWVRDFHAKYYRPSNAVLTLSGGFEPDQAVELIRRYFAPIDSAPRPRFEPPPLPAPRTEEKRLELLDGNAKTQALLFGWRIPATRTPAHFALEMVARVLADGDSSTLYDRLVRRNGWARDVSAYTYDHRDSDAFVIFVELTEQADSAKVTALIDEELSRLSQSGPSESALLRSRQRTKSAFILGLQSNQNRAMVLGQYAAMFDNPRLVARDLEGLLRVTSADVTRATRDYLQRPARTVVHVTPKPADLPPPTDSKPARTSTAVNEVPVR